jgi:hypothetical protein
MPMVDITKANIKLPGKPVTPDVFKQIKTSLQPLYPKGFIVQKGQGLGLMEAEVCGELNDLIVFSGAGLCCFKKESLEKLNRTGITPIQMFPLIFETGSKWDGKIVEGAVHGLVSFGCAIHPQNELKECEHCGGYNLKRLDESKICIKRSSIPMEGDFFAVKEWGTVHIVTERFKEACFGVLNNASFTEVPIVEK